MTKEIQTGEFKLLEAGDVDRVIPTQDYERLTAILAQELGEDGVITEGLEEGVKVGDALDIWNKMGASNPSAETLIHRYLQGRALQTEEPQTLSEIVKSKASSLERRLLGIHQSLGLNRYTAEEEVDGNQYVTQANKGEMSVEVLSSPNSLKSIMGRYLFTVNIGKTDGGEGPEKPEVRYDYWSPGKVALTVFPGTGLAWSIGNLYNLTSPREYEKNDAKSWLHDVYVWPFKYADYLVKKAAHGIKRLSQNKGDPRVRVDYAGESHSLEEFIGCVVGSVDSNSDESQALRSAVKNLVPALERDLVQAQDYANGLEV